MCDSADEFYRHRITQKKEVKQCIQHFVRKRHWKRPLGDLDIDEILKQARNKLLRR